MRFSSFQLGNAHVATQEASGAFSPEISGNNNRKKEINISYATAMID